MYQLILHHIYRNGPFAIDISGYENDGLTTAVSYLQDGIDRKSGALLFKSPHSRIRVPLKSKSLFQRLFALKIEMTVRIDALGHRRNLIEGDDSFAFFIDSDGYLWGTYNGSQYNGGPKIWHGANSRDASPDGIQYKVPLHQWVNLLYEHDGFASIRLYINGTLVAVNYSLRSGVSPVVNTGINIGNWTLIDAYTFDGAIDEVKIWRWDPDDSLGNFLSRPMDKSAVLCWKEFFDWLTERLNDPNDRERTINLLHCLQNMQTEMVRLLRSKGEKIILENDKFSEEYRDLWQHSPLDSKGMEKWQKRWFDWLIKVIGMDAWKSFVENLQQCLYRSEMLNRLPKFDCDKEFAEYLMEFAKITGNQFVNNHLTENKGG